MSREIKFRAWDGREMTTTFCITSQGCIRFYPLGMQPRELDHYKTMQYTGLKDKNGKEIYCDDFIADGDRTWLIIWDDESCKFLLDEIKGLQASRPCNTVWVEGMEIIGNRFENPELLKP